MQRAKREARRRHRPIYIVGDELTATRPRRPTLTAWPSGDVTLGVPTSAGRELERRYGSTDAA